MPAMDLRHRVHKLLNRVPVASRHLESRRTRRAAAFYGEFISPGDLVFDIGANVGNRAAAFEEMGAVVVAVEPEEGCVRDLRKRFHGKDSVKVIGKACGAEPGVSEIMVSATDSERSTMSPQMKATEGVWEDQEWSGTQEVEVTTLDLLISENGIPEFCKIDVENFEREVLLGLSRPIPALSFEFHKVFADKVDECLRILERLGTFSVAASRAESMRLSTPWGEREPLLEWIELHPDPVLWGDIYVRFESMSQ